ncbi:MAG: aminoglycoside phosphotransferase family protein [Symbiobacteriaceae bacterium]|nr:aminoglycoside phosphotransferase family protein [Symbiobacteriaceae bacterium]
MQFIAADRTPGHFQASLTADQIKAVCRSAFGATAEVLLAQELTSGFFNSTYIVEIAGMPRFILRVAPAEDAPIFPNERFQMRREYTVQPFLAPVCPLVPKTVWADFTHNVIDRDFVFQSFIEGDTWGKVRDSLSDAENNAIRRQLGAIARQINSVQGQRFGFPSPEPGFATWSGALIDFLGGMHQNVTGAGLDDVGSGQLLAWVESHRALFDEIRQPVLCHGDLWPQNVLVRRTAAGVEIVGILDSERAMWGDPMFEWTYQLGSQQPAYWEGYGARDESESARVRALAYRGIFLVLVWMEQQRFHSDASRVRTDLPAVLAALP